jgi:ribosome maturation protein Sdo1
MVFNNIQDGKASTMNDVNKVMATDNYKIAKQIVQSLYVKE